MKLYIIKVKYNTMIKTFYFQAEKTKETMEQWAKAIQELNIVKKNSIDEFDYLKNVQIHFKNYGFQRIAK